MQHLCVGGLKSVRAEKTEAGALERPKAYGTLLFFLPGEVTQGASLSLSSFIIIFTLLYSFIYFLLPLLIITTASAIYSHG